MQRALTIHFLSDWQISSGLGDGSLADSVLIRDVNGLPYIPGRSLKGVMREAARELALVDPMIATMNKQMFGTASQAKSEKAGWQTGYLRVGRADLISEMRDILMSCKPALRSRYVRDMTVIRYQTAIDSASGSTLAHSLRSLECGVAGLEFTADVSISCCEDENQADIWLRAVCAMVRSMGSGRNRGLGRCRIACPQWSKGEANVPEAGEEVCK